MKTAILLEKIQTTTPAKGAVKSTTKLPIKAKSASETAKAQDALDIIQDEKNKAEQLKKEAQAKKAKIKSSKADIQAAQSDSAQSAIEQDGSGQQSTRLKPSKTAGAGQATEVVAAPDVQNNTVQELISSGADEDLPLNIGGGAAPSSGWLNGWGLLGGAGALGLIGGWLATRNDSSSSSSTATVETSPAPTVKLKPITTDNILNAVESSSNVMVSGTVAGDAKEGDTVAVIVNGQTYSTTVKSGNVFEVAVAGSELANDSTVVARVSTTNSAGKSGTGDAIQSYTIDTSAPELSVGVDTISQDGVLNAAEVGANVPVTGVVAGASSGDRVSVVVNGKTFTTIVSADGSYSVDVPGSDLKADSDKTVDVTVVSKDSAGNTTTANGNGSYTVDELAPSPTLTINSVTADGVLTAAESTGSVSITGTVDGALTGDIVTLTAPDNTTYTTTVKSDGTYAVNVPADSLTKSGQGSKQVTATVTTKDSAGNIGTSAVASKSYTVDTLLPTATLTLDKVTADGNLTTAEQATAQTTISGVATGDVVSGDIVTLVVNNTTYTAAVGTAGVFSTTVATSDLVADSDKTVSASVTMLDAAGNAGTTTAAKSYTLTTNTSGVVVKPTIAITSDAASVGSGESTTITFTLSEASTDFTVEDIVTSAGSLGALSTTDNITYTAVYTPVSNSTTTAKISVASNKFSNSAGELNVDGGDTNNFVTISVDTQAPTIEVTTTTTTELNSGETAVVNFVLSEASTDFTQSDITFSGGTLSNWSGSGTNYSVTFTPTAGSTTAGSVGVDSAKFKDASKNLNQDAISEANNKVTFAVNTVAPTVAITTDATDNELSRTDTSEITFTFSEATLDFTNSDIELSGGTLSAVSTSDAGLTYTATFTPNITNGSAIIKVDSNKFSNSVGNFNTDGAQANNEVNLTILAVNNAPQMVGSQGGSIDEDTASTAPLTGTATASDLDSDTLSFSAGTSAGSFGDFAIDASTGKWQYKVNNSKTSVQELGSTESVSESFVITVTDNKGGSATQVVTVVVNGMNDAPTISGAVSTGSVTEDNTVAATGTIGATDLDGDTLNYSASVTAGNFGNFAVNSAGEWTYSVDSTKSQVQDLGVGKTLTESFSVTVSDGKGGSATQVVTVKVNGANDASTINSATTSGSVIEDSTAAATGSISATDRDGDAITYSAAVTAGSFGNLSINSSTGAWSYSADNTKLSVQALSAGESISESFSVTVNDGTGSVTQIVTVVVNGVNDAPIAVNDVAPSTVVEGATAALTGSVASNDSDDDTVLTYTISQSVPGLTFNTDGTYSFDASNSEYNSIAKNASLIVEVPYTVTDPAGATATAKLSITISGENDAPIATADTGSANKNAPLTGSVADNDSDPDGDTLTYQASSVAGLTFNTDGTYSFDASNAAYSSLGLGDTQSVVVNYTVNDGNSSVASTLTILVTGVSNAPTITSTAQTGTVAEDGTVAASGTVTATDVDGDTLSYIAGTTAGEYGTFAINSSTGAWTYTVNNANAAVQVLSAGENASESFVVTVDDGNGGLATQNVTVTITGVNDAPTFTSAAQSGTVNEDSTVAATGTITATDKDQDALEFSTTDTGTHGTFSINSSSGAWSYVAKDTPTVQALGVTESLVESFTVTINDNNGGTATQVVTVTVRGTNDAPTSTIPGAKSITEDQSFAGTLAAISDVDGDTTSYLLNAAPSHGTLTLNATTGEYSYTPNANYHGTDSFTYAVSDGVASSTFTVSINISNQNDAPTSANTTLTTQEDSTAITGTLTAIDLDGDSLTFSTLSAPTHGTLTLSTAGAYSYKPFADYFGTDTFTYSVNDGAATNTYTVTVNVTSTNDAPSASNTFYNVNEDATYSGSLPTATDPEGDSYTYSQGSLPSHGTVTINSDGTFSYVPSANYHGSDSFTYVVKDINNATSTYTVTMGVQSIDDLPVIVDFSNTLTYLEENTASTGLKVTDVNAMDPDGTTITYTLTSNSAGANSGYYSIDSATGVITLTANGAAWVNAGNDLPAITVTATDADGSSVVGTVSVPTTTDVDDIGAVFTSAKTAKVAENVAANQLVYTANAVDSLDSTSGGDVSYSLGGTDSLKFDIDSLTGQVSLKASPNFESVGSYLFNVIATDEANNVTSQTVTLSVSNVDEVAPTITSDSIATAIFENTGSDQIVYTAAGKDTVDFTDGVVTWSLSGADSASFSIDSVTGEVKLKDNPNFDDHTSYSFKVVGKDVAGNQSSKAVTLEIKNVLTPYLSIDTISGDRFINAAEDDALRFSGYVSDVEAGQIVTLVLTTSNGAQATIEAEVGTDRRWRTDTLDARLWSEGNVSVTGSVSNVAGEVTVDTEVAVLDRTAPSITSVNFGTTLDSGLYYTGDPIEIHAVATETVAAGSQIVVQLDTGEVVTLTAETAGSTLSTIYRPTDGQFTGNLLVTSVSSTQVSDLAGNAMADLTVVNDTLVSSGSLQIAPRQFSTENNDLVTPRRYTGYTNGIWIDGSSTVIGAMGQNGDDTINFAAETVSVAIDLAAGRATSSTAVDTITSFENAIGGSVNDILTGSGIGNVLDGGDGNDSLIGGAGNDTYVSWSGTDSIVDSEGTSDWIDLSGRPTSLTIVLNSVSLGGIENAVGSAFNDTIIGSFYNNIILAGTGDDSVDAGEGSDTVDAGTGKNTVFGGGGNDSIVSSDDADFLDGGANNDTIYSAGGDDTLVGGLGDDTLSSGDGADTINAGGGDDTLNGGNGSDSLQGGDGNDWVDYSDMNQDIILNMETKFDLNGDGSLDATMGIAQTESGEDTLVNIENVLGGKGKDYITGNNSDNILDGGFGNDTLDGGAGGGSDTLIGGVGNDWAYYRSATGDVQVNLNTGVVSGASGADSVSLIENVAGGSFNDSLTAASVGSILKGNDGSDTLMGGVGNDTIYTGAAYYELDSTGAIVSSKGDVVSAGNGNDWIYYENGATAQGGAGNDTFVAEGAVDWTFTSVNGGVGTADLLYLNSSGENHAVTFQFTSGGTSNPPNITGMEILDLGKGNNHLALTDFENVQDNAIIETITGSTTAALTIKGIDGVVDLPPGYLLVGSVTAADGNLYEIYTNASAGAMGFSSSNDTVWVDSDLIVNTVGVLTPIADDYTGTDASEVIWARSSADTIFALGGDDTVRGDGIVDSTDASMGPAADKLDGGANTAVSLGGGDWVDFAYADSLSPVIVNLATQRATAETFVDTIVNFEHAKGGFGNDTLIGDDSTNWLFGGWGNDTLQGGLGNDTLEGGRGNDSIDGGVETSDWAYYGRAYGNVTVNLDLVNDTAIGAEGVDTLIGIENVWGGKGNDLIDGGGEANILYGAAGRDILRGNDGNDTLDGGAGADVLNGGNGNDYFKGEAGDDNYFGGNGKDTLDYREAVGDIRVAYEYPRYIVNSSFGEDSVYVDWAGLQFVEVWLLGNGNDIFTGSNTSNTDSVFGGNGNDWIKGGPGNDFLDGGNGNDTIVGGIDNDTMIGGNGTDWADFTNSSRSVVVDLESVSGAATIQMASIDAANIDSMIGFENIRTSSGNDSLGGDINNNHMMADAGNDTLDGKGGDDTLDGGSGNDAFIMRVGDGSDILIGGDGNDFLSFSALTSGLEMTMGTSTVQTAAGLDTLYSIEYILATNFDDKIVGSSGNDTIDGGSGNDYINGDAGADSLLGSNGDDSLSGGLGNDTLNGGNGLDWADYTYLTSLQGVTVSMGNAGAGKATISAADIDVFQTVENVITGAGNDSVSDIWSANGNGYTVKTGAGDDTVYAGDLVNSDWYDGGDGSNDWIDFGYFGVWNNSAVQVNLTTGLMTNVSWVNVDTVKNFEHVIGTTANDSIFGDDKANFFKGGSGNDSLIGNTGNDTLYGEAGNDFFSYILTGDGNDLIDGGTGDDTISFTNMSLGAVIIADSLGVYSSGAGNDTIKNVEVFRLGVGNDTFSGSTKSETILSGVGDDVISAGIGNDSINGEAGNDTLDFSYTGNFGVIVNLKTANGTSYVNSQDKDTFSNIEVVITGAGNDSIIDIWQANKTTVFTGAGDDTILASDLQSEDLFNGGDGNDWIEFNTAGQYYGVGATVDLTNDTVRNYYGAYYVDTVVSFEHVITSDFADSLVGGAEANFMRAAGNNDTLNGMGGNDTLWGEAGNDLFIMTSGDGNDKIDGGSGSDSIDFSSFSAGQKVNLSNGGVMTSDAGTDTLISIEYLKFGVGNDSVVGSTGGDTISTGDGDDTLSGGKGNDSLVGGNNSDISLGGGDWVDYSYVTDSTQGVTVDLAGNTGTASVGADVDVYVGIEHAMGGSGNDKLLGSAIDNILSGGAGNDTFGTSAGDDTIFGGSGNDWMDYSTVAGGMVVNLAGFYATGDGTDSIIGIEHLQTGTGNYADSVLGDASVGNWFRTFLGNDRVLSDGDTLASVGTGNDTVNPGNGDDTVYMGGGNDALLVDFNNQTNFTANDQMFGGDGVDALTFVSTGMVVDLGNAGFGTNIAQFERIDLTGTGNNKVTFSTVDLQQLTADTKFYFVVDGNSGDSVVGAAANGFTGSFTNTANSAVSFDVDGDGTAASIGSVDGNGVIYNVDLGMGAGIQNYYVYQNTTWGTLLVDTDISRSGTL